MVTINMIRMPWLFTWHSYRYVKMISASNKSILICNRIKNMSYKSIKKQERQHA